MKSLEDYGLEESERLSESIAKKTRPLLTEEEREFFRLILLGTLEHLEFVKDNSTLYLNWKYARGER